jgi:hypothetical protein
MPGMGFETSLIEAAYRLMIVLMILVLVAVVAGIMTLPIGVLGTKSFGFALDSSGRSIEQSWSKSAVSFRSSSASSRRSSFSYFGVFDWPAHRQRVKKPGPTQAAVRMCSIDLRDSGERSGRPSQDVAINWALPGQGARVVELWNGQAPTSTLDKLFPEQPSGPPDSAGPQSVPQASDRQSRGLHRRREDRQALRRYEHSGSRQGDLFLATAISIARSRSKSNQDRNILQMRAVLLYILLVLGPIRWRCS